MGERSGISKSDKGKLQKLITEKLFVEILVFLHEYEIRSYWEYKEKSSYFEVE